MGQKSYSSADTAGINTQSVTAPVINILDGRSITGKYANGGKVTNNISLTSTDFGAIQAGRAVALHALDQVTAVTLDNIELAERLVDEQATLTRHFVDKSAALSREVMSQSERSSEKVNQALLDAKEDGGNTRRILYWGSSLALGLAGLVTVGRIVEARS